MEWKHSPDWIRISLLVNTNSRLRYTGEDGLRIGDTPRLFSFSSTVKRQLAIIYAGRYIAQLLRARHTEAAYLNLIRNSTASFTRRFPGNRREFRRRSYELPRRALARATVNYGVQLAEVPGVPLNREQIATKFTTATRQSEEHNRPGRRIFPRFSE